MKQTSLLSFLKNGSSSSISSSSPSSSSSHSSPTDSPYPYFYLQWCDKKPKAQAHFLSEKPKLCNFKKSILWKDLGSELLLCGHFEHLRDIDLSDPTSYSHLYKLDKEKKYRNVGFLKSLLQKAIRRKNPNVAVKCAFHYMTLDIQDFLRRLPIIIIEDTCAHEVLPTLVWLMIASTTTEFKFDKLIYEYLMGVVYVVAGIPFYHALPHAFEKDQVSLRDLLIQSNGRNQVICALIYSLLLRKAYGGMLGDMKMLEEYAHYYKDKEESALSKIPIRPILLASINVLQLSDWLLEAIDFHCAEQILEYIREEYPEYTKEYIQGLLWNYSSKINLRIKDKVDKKYKLEDWQKIKKYTQRIQYYLLEENY